MRHPLLIALALAGCGKSSIEGPMTFGGRVVEVATLERGQDLYNRYCATCHGYTGKADTPQARQLDPLPRDLSKADFKRVSQPGGLPSDEELGGVIRNGIPGTGMPPWPQLDGSDLDAVIQFLKTLSPRWQSPTPSVRQNAPKGSMKALPAAHSTASFRAADEPVAPAQGMGSIAVASTAPPPGNGAIEDDFAGSRTFDATGPEHLAAGVLLQTDTDLNLRSAR